MDEGIEKRNEDINILHSGLRAWLKEIGVFREVFREWVR